MTAPTDRRPVTDKTDAYWQKVAEVVDRAPPLGPTQKARLAILFRDAVRDRARACRTSSTTSRKAAA